MKNLLRSISYIILTSLLLLSNANATCSSTLVEDPGDALKNFTVCVTQGEKSQEFHYGPIFGGTSTGGDLEDYKRGASDSIDPTKIIGSWTSDADAHTITYIYPLKDGSTKEYTYNLYVDISGPITSFWYCNGTNGAGDIKIDAVLFGKSDACPN